MRFSPGRQTLHIAVNRRTCPKEGALQAFLWQIDATGTGIKGEIGAYARPEVGQRGAYHRSLAVASASVVTISAWLFCIFCG
jgi:hypothetical protein